MSIGLHIERKRDVVPKQLEPRIASERLDVAARSVKKLSTQTTSRSSLRRPSHRWEPRKPAPPVTSIELPSRTVFVFSLGAGPQAVGDQLGREVLPSTAARSCSAIRSTNAFQSWARAKARRASTSSGALVAGPRLCRCRHPFVIGARDRHDGFEADHAMDHSEMVGRPVARYSFSFTG